MVQKLFKMTSTVCNSHTPTFCLLLLCPFRISAFSRNIENREHWKRPHNSSIRSCPIVDNFPKSIYIGFAVSQNMFLILSRSCNVLWPFIKQCKSNIDRNYRKNTSVWWEWFSCRTVLLNCMSVLHILVSLFG